MAETIRAEMDTFGSWVKDCCRLDPDVRGPFRLLFNSYRDYAEAIGGVLLNEFQFNKELNRLGYRSSHSGGSVRKGITLKSLGMGLVA